MNILKLKKMGMDFYENIDSDLQNYRLRLYDEIETKDGEKICGDIMRGNISEYQNGKCKTIRNNGLAFDFQYEDEKGCWRYLMYEKNGEYNHQEYKNSYYKKDYLLSKINEISVIQYDDIEIIK